MEYLAHYAGLAYAVPSREELDVLLAQMVEARDTHQPRTYRRLRDRVICSQLRFIVRIASRYRGLTLEDRIGEGVIGLMTALDRYDLSRRVALSTYASWWIRQAIRRACQDKGRCIRLPVHHLEARGAIMRATVRSLAITGKRPTVEELARATGETTGMMAAALAPATAALSLDAVIVDAPGLTLHDAVADSDALSPLDALLARERETEARRALAELPPAERAVLSARFALDGAEGQTLDAVGAGVLAGRSRERARQVQQAGLRRMRGRLDPALRR